MSKKISELTALTAPASGDYIPIVDISEALPADQTKRITLNNFSSEWQAWTPVFTGFSADPASGVYRYMKMGKLCYVAVSMPNAGTSNTTGFRISAPLTAKTITSGNWQAALPYYVNAGTAVFGQGMVSIITAGTEFILYTAGNTWTDNGDKRANFTIFYELP